MKRKLLFLIMVSLISSGGALLHGQVSFTGREVTSLLNNGYEMFDKAKYATAIELFDRWLAEEPEGDPLERADAEYHAALASMRLMAPDAGYRLQQFIAGNGESPMVNQARFEMGRYYYQQRNYGSAIGWFELTDRNALSVKELPEYLFKLGYSHYRRGDTRRAQMLFGELKDVDTDYTPPAIYYYSAIAYENGFYSTALEGFERLTGDETFGTIVPFYITQIYYIDKNYDGILEMAPSLIAQAGSKRETELYRFIGDAYFQRGSYEEAIPYLEKFISGTRLSDRNDKYELAFSYYQTGATSQAVRLFNEVVGRSDILTQNAYFMLGSCYLKEGDKKKAQMAFSAASGMSYDPAVQEEALFNFAKLAYENSYAPFGEGIEALHTYISSYPNSDNVSEAYDYLISAFMRLKNYQAALTSLEKISSRDERLMRAYQKVAYYRGTEQFRNRQYADAVTSFGKSLLYKEMNSDLHARALYWRGESSYRLGADDAALNDWESFRKVPGASSLDEYRLIEYNLGYLWYNRGDYQRALQHFIAFNNKAGGESGPEMTADTRNRIADCYYIRADYPSAISYYDRVIEYGRLDADYALFQKGFAQGLSNNNQAKISTLTGLINNYQSSAYLPNALFERGRAYVAVGEPSRGEADFMNIVAWHTSSQFVPPSLVQLGLIYYNAGDNAKAVAQFKKVIENYRDTPEARNAVSGLRNAYTDMDDVQSFFAYMERVEGVGDIELSTRDSMTYISGENQYIRGDCERASATFRSYLQQFPSGAFATNARFYLADCLNREGHYDEALDLYLRVVSVGNNQFMEQSLLSAAIITYTRGDYQRSWSLYQRLADEAATPENRLSASLGMMRSAAALDDQEKVILSAELVLGSEKLTEELAREATFLTARASQILGNNEDALDDYRRVAYEVATLHGAESKYRVAELLWLAGDVEGAEREANEFIDMSSPHAYWTGMTFLLLSEIAARKGDTFQARATLQSLIDYYTVSNDGIIDEARARLARLTDDAGGGEK